MIAFRYTKTDGAEYLSHLDLLRHVYRTLRRAGIRVEMSGGFHPHPNIFMNNPLGLGIKSVAEYCAVDAVFDGDFKEAFNALSPHGVKCSGFREVSANPNYAESIKSCAYTARGIGPFDPQEILQQKSIVICDLRGRQTDIRERIYSLACADGEISFTLGCGQKNLRPDLFCAYLQGLYGGAAREIIKVRSIGDGTF